jgi:predicted NACHT family NTPase
LVQQVREFAYADIKKRVGTMRMLRVNQPIPVTDIYVDLNIFRRVSSDFSFTNWPRESEDNNHNGYSFDRLGVEQAKRERIPAQQAIRECRRLTLLGKPGAGKTTLLKMLANACIEDKLVLNESKHIPVFITLQEIAKEERSLWDEIQSQFRGWGIAEAAEPILKQGRAIVLLDGLDEVPISQNNYMTRQILRFCQEYSNNRFVVTCRTQSLRSPFEDFTEAEIADFTPEQISQYVFNWSSVVVGHAEATKVLDSVLQDSSWEAVSEFNLDQIAQASKNLFLKVTSDSEADKISKELVQRLSEYSELSLDLELVNATIQLWFFELVKYSIAVRFTNSFISQLSQNKAIAEIAVAPILLSLTCSVFLDEQGNLPNKRVDLYQKGIRDLLVKWDQFKGIQQRDGFRSISLDEKENLLAWLAYTLFQDNDYFPEQRKLINLIANHFQIQRSEAEQILRSLEAQHGLIIERSEGYFSFSHLTLQEYFAALYIVDNKSLGMLQALASNIGYSNWREVFLITLEMLPDIDRGNLLFQMKQQIDFLVEQDGKLKQFLIWVNTKAQSVKATYKPASVRIFYAAHALALFPGIANESSRHLAQTTELDFVLVGDPESTLKFGRALANNPNLRCDIALDLSLGIAVIRVICILQKRELIAKQYCQDLFQRTGNSIYKTLSSIIPDIFLSNYDLHYALQLACALTNDLNLSSELKLDLERLKEQLSPITTNHAFGEKREESLKQLEEWWQCHGTKWLEQLRAVMVEYRNVGHDWQFTEDQEEQLKRYFNANNFLISCLSKGYGVYKNLGEKIKETLLLLAAEED